MDMFITDEIITAHGVSEPSSSVGVPSSPAGSTRRPSSDWANVERRVGPGAPSRSENTTGDQSYEDSEFEVGGDNERCRRIKEKDSSDASSPPKKNAKLLEFTNDIGEVVKKKESGNLKAIGERYRRE